MIHVCCDKCSRSYNVRDSLAGKIGKCECGKCVPVPYPEEEEEIEQEPNYALRRLAVANLLVVLGFLAVKLLWH